ncbi:MAG: hypothetical protein IKG22_09585 [Atopobiaceae bacterium]|nr:hypothetical protein [Atopobiaceae bacterium]
MNFLCPHCKKRITKEEYSPPKLIEDAGIHDIGFRTEWVEELDVTQLTLPAHKRKRQWWVCSDQRPVTGERRTLRVEMPFDANVGDEFTTLFEPADMYYNGWEFANPEEASRACAVRCCFDGILWSDDFSAFIIVKVLKVVPLERLYAKIPKTVTDYRFFEEFCCEYGPDSAKYISTEYEDDHWLYRDWADSGGYMYHMQLIYSDDQGIRHEVLTCWSAGCHANENLYHFGNMVNK